MRVLGFGTYDTAKHPRVGIVLDGLRAHGQDVVEVNAPMGFTTAERVEMLTRPWLVWRMVTRILGCWLRLARRSRAARRTQPFDAVVVGYLGHFDVVLAKALFPRTTIVLDMLIFAADTARDRGASGGIKLRLLDLLDRLAVACADVVMVDTEEHARLVPARARSKALVVPVGAPDAWFDAGVDVARGTGGPLRVVFYGLYTPLQGATTIGQALKSLADRDDIEVTMIGAGQDLPAARAAAEANTHVTWLDWVTPERLATVVADHDVCLGVFGTTPKALRVVPNKVFQGAAAGCAILTSGTDPQRRMLADAAVFTPPGAPQELADAVSALADDRARLARLRAAARERAQVYFSPSAIVEPLIDRLDGC